jgi:hypothetical protein
MSKAQMDAASVLIPTGTEPTNPNDVFTDSIITFGTCKTEWVVRARDFAYFDVECIKHPDTTNIGQRQHIRHASTAVWLLS